MQSTQLRLKNSCPSYATGKFVLGGDMQEQESDHTQQQGEHLVCRLQHMVMTWCCYQQYGFSQSRYMPYPQASSNPLKSWQQRHTSFHAGQTHASRHAGPWVTGTPFLSSLINPHHIAPTASQVKSHLVTVATKPARTQSPMLSPKAHTPQHFVASWHWGAESQDRLCR